MFFKNITRLTLVFLLTLTISQIGCKKSITTPDVEDLTRPVIWLSVFEMSFSACEAGGTCSPQSLKVKNSGVSTLNYTISDDADWLSIDPTSGSSTGQAIEHTVSVNKDGLATQDESYSATITVICPEGYNNPQKVTVSLTITKEPPPEIWVNTQELEFSAQEDGSNPSFQNIKRKNKGQSTLNYNITKDASWLNVNPESGSSQGNEKTHKVSVDISGLSEGTYSGTLTIADSKATNSPQLLNVTLAITKEPSPIIWVSSKNLTFEAIEGGQNPSSQIIRIKNNGGGTLSYEVSGDASWMAVSPNGGNSQGEEISHTVSVNIGGLGVGTYYGTITIAAPNATNSPQLVNVTLELSSVSTDNKIEIYCSPGSGPTDTIVSIPISIKGNLKEINVFGSKLTFDAAMFQFQSISKGTLTGTWAAVNGNEISSGTVMIGGFLGSGTPIPIGSEGSIAVITLKVTGSGYSDGHQSQISIQNYADDIVGMTPEPSSTIYTYKK